MATSRASLIRRHFRQRFGIAAPRVGVRSELQWYWRAFIWVVVLSSSLAAALWIYDAGRLFAGYDHGRAERDLGDLRAEIVRLTSDLSAQGEATRTLEGRLQVELATIDQLGAQLRQSQKENAAIKEELALFEALVSSAVATSESVKFARVRVEPAAVAGRYRFSVLLVRQVTAKNSKELSGELQFSIRIKRSGVDGMMVVPGEGNPVASHYRVLVKHLHRAEGEFSLPPGATYHGGEIRLLQDGVIKLRQTLS